MWLEDQQPKKKGAWMWQEDNNKKKECGEKGGKNKLIQEYVESIIKFDACLWTL